LSHWPTTDPDAPLVSARAKRMVVAAIWALCGALYVFAVVTDAPAELRVLCVVFLVGIAYLYGNLTRR
jgi:hypothetical protein